MVADDSELPMPILIAAMTNNKLPKNVGVGESGGLVSLAEVEDINFELVKAMGKGIPGGYMGRGMAGTGKDTVLCTR